MRLTIRCLGLDILDVCIEQEATVYEDAGDCTSYPVGFVVPECAPYEIDCPER